MQVNLIIIIKVLLAQQCKLPTQYVNLVKITDRSQVMGRAGASLFISLSLKPGEKTADLSAALSHHERDFQPPPCPPKATHNLLRTPCKPCPPAQLIDGNAFPKKATILFYYGIFKKKEGKKNKKKITMSRKVGKVTLSRQGLLFSP